MSDDAAGIVAAVHAGRIGTSLDVVGRALEAMVDLGAHARPGRACSSVRRSAAPATRCPPAMQRRGRVRGRPARRRRPAGARRVSTSVQGCASSPARRGRRRRRLAHLHGGVGGPLLAPTRRRGLRADRGGRTVHQVTDARTAELAANLGQVRAQIAGACQRAGRSPQEVTLVAVTKTWPAEDVRRLVGLGVHDVAENRDQEAADKADGLCRARCALALRRPAADQQGPVRRPLRRRRADGRPAAAGAGPRPGCGRRLPVVSSCSCRSPWPRPRTATRPGAVAAPRTSRRSATPSRRAEALRARGSDGRGTAGRRPGARLRPASRGRGRRARLAPRGRRGCPRA